MGCFVSIRAGGLVILAAAALAQPGPDNLRNTVQPGARADRAAVLATAIRLDVRLVLIPVTVADSSGRPAPDLPRAAFRLYEDGVEQDLRYFAASDAPVSLGLVFDASGSMRSKIERSRAAVSQLVKTAMPGDEFLLVAFNDQPEVLRGFTQVPEELEDSLASIEPDGATALFDAVYLALHRMSRAKNSRKALLVISDGSDNNSRYSEAEIRGMVREQDVCIYAIGILGPGAPDRGMKVLGRLTGETGGRLFLVQKADELPAAMEKMGAALRRQYVLGYSSKNHRSDGKYRKVDVKLAQPADAPPLRASWRAGYFAPAGR